VQLLVYRPEALYLKGWILQQQENLSEARLIWLKAKSESEVMGERKMRWQILAGLAGVAENEFVPVVKDFTLLTHYLLYNVGYAEV
jgi:hypothetical protein